MRIALVNTNKSSRIYPVSLLKIGAYLKDNGHECKLFDNSLPKPNIYDQIWLTTLFTYDIDYSIKMALAARERCNEIKIGGISASLLPDYFKKAGLNVHTGLLPEAEEYNPDYSLLECKPEYSISYLSRGCIRKCGFCMVPKIEGGIIHKKSWVGDLNKSGNVLFFDNNWLSSPNFENDCDTLRKLVKSNRIKSIDFNQGLDCRLMTEKKADMIKGLPITPIRFAFDGMQEDKYYQKAVKLMIERGFNRIMTYVLYNYNDSPQDFYYRLKESAKLTKPQTHPNTQVDSFPMLYQPVTEINKGRKFVGKLWTRQYRNNFVAMISAGFITGQITVTGGHFDSPLDEFEYWFGKDENEFMKLLSYPDLRKLLKRKRGDLRMKRDSSSTRQ